MSESPAPLAVNIRPAYPEDSDGITRTYMESAQHHFQLEPERYLIPSVQAIAERYREGRQHPPESEGTTLVAELGGEIVGFVDVRLDRSPDPMHRDFVYCHVVEIAVSQSHQDHGIGAQLLKSAEEWGRQRGATYASLEHLAANAHAGEFYRRKGYNTASVFAIKRL